MVVKVGGGGRGGGWRLCGTGMLSTEGVVMVEVSGGGKGGGGRSGWRWWLLQYE